MCMGSYTDVKCVLDHVLLVVELGVVDVVASSEHDDALFLIYSN